MRVLIGVDGSADAYAAVGLAGHFLSSANDEVVLYYSLPAISPSWHHRVKPELVEQARTALSAAVFKEAIDRLPSGLGPKVKTVVGTHAPGHGILTAADECRADLVVVGSRGAEPESGLALGSVARQVAHESTIPVLIVRPRAEHRADDGLRVLFATDGSNFGQQMAAVLNKITWPTDAVGRLITVVEAPWAGQIPAWLEIEMQNYDLKALGFGAVEDNAAEKARVCDQLRQSCGELPAIFCREEPIVAAGFPSRQILNKIASENINLVVVGARRRSALGRWFLGSTSERLLANAPCSVLLVREHENP